CSPEIVLGSRRVGDSRRFRYSRATMGKAVSRCSNVIQLPSCIWNITSLCTFNLDNLSSLVHGCSSLVKLPSISNASDIYEYSGLVESSSSTGNVNKLKKLILNGCSSLVELSFFIQDLSNFQELELRGCSNGNHKHSDKLVIRGVDNLQKQRSLRLLEPNSATENPTVSLEFLKNKFNIFFGDEFPPLYEKPS
ncbi:unnamed protein product, partial [Thlaspi arvense]